MKYSCYQDCSVIHGWFVYCTFCWQMHRLSKSLEIWFRMASFSKKGAYSLALAWGIKELKSLKRFWNTWWPSEAASRLVSLSNYCLWCVFFVFFFSVSWSRVYGLCGLSLYASNDLTYNSTRFKKPLDIFWPQIQKKRFRRLFIYDFGCKQKTLSDFLPSSSSWKRANTGKPA